MDRGFFLVLEGVEGAGKTTQAQLISRWLEELAVPHRLAREPGGTRVGEAIRSVLLDSEVLEIIPETELLLMLGARAALVSEVVKPTIERGEVMVADRFELSSLAYQALARGLGLDRVRDLNAFATGGVRPDLTLLFDIPASVGRARQADMGKRPDRIEREGAAFLESVGQAYRTLAGEDDSIEVVDASVSAMEVHGTVRTILRSRLPGPFGLGRG